MITSSPDVIPAPTQSRWRPAVPLDTAAAWAPRRLPRTSPRSARSSARATAGPSGGRRGRAPLRARRARSRESDLADCGRRRVRARRLDRVEPVAPALAAPVDGVEVGGLQLQRDRADAELDVVHRTHGCELHCSAGHEDLVRDRQVGADARLLDHAPPGHWAIWITVLRVIPGRIDVESGGVRTTPSSTTKTFSPAPSAT